MKVAVRRFSLLTLNLIFLASSSNGQKSVGRGVERFELCRLSENGYYGNRDVAEPVFEHITFHYQLEHEEDAVLQDILDELEGAMGHDVIKRTSLFTECQQQNRGRALLSALRSLATVPGKRIEVKPAISTKPPDHEDTERHCPKASAAGTKCVIMDGFITFYYPVHNKAEFESKVPQITADITGVIKSAMDSGEYNQISGVSDLKYLTSGEYLALPQGSEPDSDSEGETALSVDTAAPGETGESGGRGAFVFPIVAASVTAGTLLMFAALFHVRNKFQSKQGRGFEGRTVSESNVV